MSRESFRAAASYVGLYARMYGFLEHELGMDRR